MRLAEFKTRLFIFFAGRLLKWAQSIERDIKYGPSRPVAPVDDSNAVLLAESLRESEPASGLPEHWARMVTTGPPQHWLDLVRERAPHLLPPLENEPLWPEATAESFGQEYFSTEINQAANGPPVSDDGAVTEPQPKALKKKRSLRESRYPPAAQANGLTWLKRLRFQPPARRAEEIELGYVADPQTRDLDSFRAAGGAAKEESKATVPEPTFGNRKGRDQSGGGTDRRIVRGPVIARSSGSPVSRSNDRVGSDDSRGPHYEAVAPSEKLPGIHSEAVREEALSIQAVKPSRPEQVVTDALRTRRVAAGEVPRRAARLNVSLERDDTDATRTRAGSGSEASPGHYVENRARANPVRDLDRGVNFSKRAGIGPLARVLPPTRADEPASELSLVPSRVRNETRKPRHVYPNKPVAVPNGDLKASGSVNPANRHTPNPPPTFRRSVVRVVASHQQTRDEFASVEPTAPAHIEPRIESSENVWPTLPPPAKFEFIDEIAASEQEAEGLRRLEMEQRGTLWNG